MEYIKTIGIVNLMMQFPLFYVNFGVAIPVVLLYAFENHNAKTAPHNTWNDFFYIEVLIMNPLGQLVFIGLTVWALFFTGTLLEANLYKTQWYIRMALVLAFDAFQMLNNAFVVGYAAVGFKAGMGAHMAGYCSLAFIYYAGLLTTHINQLVMLLQEYEDRQQAAEGTSTPKESISKGPISADDM